MYTLVCEDSISGVFSGIYKVWEEHYNREEVIVKAGLVENYELFMKYRSVAVDLEASQKVAGTIRRRFGEEAYETVCYALWSCQGDKADAVYRMIRYGIEHQCGAELIHHLTEPSIERVFELQRASFNEAHHYLGFLRFSELEGGILHARINPKNDVLEVLAEHFADRLPNENWMIQDENRGKVAIHKAFDIWIVTKEEEVQELLSRRRSGADEEFRSLWKRFYTAVSIEARENPALQRQNLPLRFRRNMVW